MSGPRSTAMTRRDERMLRVALRAAARGDGRVTWDRGIPDGVRTWYMRADHGQLAAHRTSFAAIEELNPRLNAVLKLLRDKGNF